MASIPCNLRKGLLTTSLHPKTLTIQLLGLLATAGPEQVATVWVSVPSLSSRLSQCPRRLSEHTTPDSWAPSQQQLA